jgi:hypothetical protein
MVRRPNAGKVSSGTGRSREPPHYFYDTGKDLR